MESEWGPGLSLRSFPAQRARQALICGASITQVRTEVSSSVARRTEHELPAGEATSGKHASTACLICCMASSTITCVGAVLSSSVASSDCCVAASPAASWIAAADCGDSLDADPAASSSCRDESGVAWGNRALSMWSTGSAAILAIGNGGTGLGNSASALPASMATLAMVAWEVPPGSKLCLCEVAGRVMLLKSSTTAGLAVGAVASTCRHKWSMLCGCWP
mmetsp:Transcript_25512/g.58893  ORF Transcript_25512/g.58893 Transcript_25512/m.58893 type:complete len:221 (-) Transcript_25512:2486-3148(-)